MILFPELQDLRHTVTRSPSNPPPASTHDLHGGPTTTEVCDLHLSPEKTEVRTPRHSPKMSASERTRKHDELGY